MGETTTPSRLPGGLSEGALYEAVVESLTDASVFVLDAGLRYAFVSGAAVSQAGWRAEELIGRRPVEVLGEVDGRALEEHLRAVLGGETRVHEHPGIRSTGAVWSSTLTPLTVNGGVVGVIVVSRDVALVKEAEGARQVMADRAAAADRVARFERWQRERLEFLAEINDVVADCADRPAVMRAVTAAAVPRLGDWCAMHLFLEPRDVAPVIEVAHVDPAMVARARELIDRFPYDPEAPTGVAQVVRTGRPEFYPEITDDLLSTLDVDAEAADAVRSLAFRSAIIVPLVKQHTVIGAMQFVISGSDRRYSADDLTLAQAVAGRVAASLDNRRLSEQQRTIAQTLQRSLLPESLPPVPGADIAVGYWAAGEGTEVGGDFYDVFALDDGTHAVVIGDVCGNGTEAAAVTALARHHIRANAWRGDDHAAVLRHLNTALMRTRPDTLCTVSYGTLAPREGGLEFRVASAGHPLPVLVQRDGTALTMGATGLILGVLEETDYPVTVATVERGEMVVLYTDGATDLPPPAALSAEEMSDLIGSAVGDAADPTEAVRRIASALGERRPFADRHDDIALVVISAT